MLTTIKLENFKSHQKTILNLDDSRLHAIVGQNSSGKTSILQAVHYLSQLANRPFSAIFQYSRAPEYLVTSGRTSLTVSVSGYWGHKPQQLWTAEFEWQQKRSDWLPSATWSTDKSDRVSGWPSSLKGAPYPIPQSIGHTVYLKLEARNLAQAAYSDELIPRVEFDGSGLAPTLDYLRSENPLIFQELETMLRKVVPSVRGIDVRRAKVEILRQRTIEVDGKALPYEERREVTGQEVILDMSSGKRIPAHAISEGTILTLGLLAVLYNPQIPNVILLDDIEQGLHPQAQRELVGLLKQILDQKPNLQILFTTHSPYIVDELVPSQVHVLNSTEDGHTITQRLDKHPDADWAAQTLTTGEFWDAEGESWVIEEPSGV